MSADRPTVAVIGAGIFGCTISLSLSDVGFRVIILERKGSPLEGASWNNQNRLHLGFHYPRDLATARQCARGFQKFVDAFPGSISGDFPNAYFISSSGSLTSPEDYLRFCDKLGLSYSRLDIHVYPTQIRGCALGLLCNEVVYDCSLLRRHLLSAMHSNPSIQLRCSTEVSDIVRSAEGYRLTLGESTENITVDAVVNCSYADINRLTERCGHPIQEYQFEYTVISIIEAEIARQGITMMDGPFMTILPYGKSNKFLLYHVLHTVVATEVGTTLDPSWRDPDTSPFSMMNAANFFETMKQACSTFVPALKTARLMGFLQGPRMVLAHRDIDDARPSIIHDYGQGYFTVFSGKIDHCIEVAENMRHKIVGYLGTPS